MPVELLSSSLSTSGIAPESSTPPVVWHYLATLSYAIAKSSSRYMQIWMNLQNQDAMATFSFASPSDNKNPRAGAQSIDRHDQSVEPGSKNRPHNNFSRCYSIPCMNDFRNSWELLAENVAAASNYCTWMLRWGLISCPIRCSWEDQTWVADLHALAT